MTLQTHSSGVNLSKKLIGEVSHTHTHYKWLGGGEDGGEEGRRREEGGRKWGIKKEEGVAQQITNM